MEIKIRSATPGTLSRTSASVVSLITDPNSANNAASADTTVTPAADLSLTKTDSPDPVFVGDLLTYTLAVHNAGPQDATGTHAHRHPAGGRDLRVGHADPGQLLRGGRHRHLRARDDRRTARTRASR